MNESKLPNDQSDQSKLIAFYLPQYHRTPENSQWWSPGYTEWTSVAKATPNFIGHYQPHIPRELGFYNLEYVDAMREQTDLARAYGIYGFCFYYYWFSGRRILERPLDNFLNSDIDFPFCLCWANENWTRTWTSEGDKILLEQGYNAGEEEQFFHDIYPFLIDSRYIKVDDKPMLLVYRIDQFPNYQESFKKWRNQAKSMGLPGLHIVVCAHHTLTKPEEAECDAIYEFPPLQYMDGAGEYNIFDEKFDLSFINKNFRGRIFDYKKMAQYGIMRPSPSFTLYRGIIPGWDNTARRQDNGTIVINDSPEKFEIWLRFLRIWTTLHRHSGNEGFIFINAWNEWSEGAHLEPDLRWGLAYLEKVKYSARILPDALKSVDTAQEIVLRELEILDPRTSREKKSRKRPSHKNKKTHAEHHDIAKTLFLRSITHALYGKPQLTIIAKKTYRAIKKIKEFLSFQTKK